MSTARHHAEWLSLLEISGPFLSMPVLLDAFPQGLDAHDPEHARELRAAYEEWADNQAGLRPEPAIHTAWIRYVLANTLELPDEVIAGGQAMPPGLRATVPEHGVTLRPDLVIIDSNRSRQDAKAQSRGRREKNNKEDLAALAALREAKPSGGVRLLIQIHPASQDLEKTIAGDPWQANPGTRMMTLLHAAKVRLGLITNGEQWMLVNAPLGETTGFVSWYASLWLEERLTLRAFHSLLGVERFFNVPEEQTLETLLTASIKDQQEVTDQLGYQVRRAVEILIQAIDRADQDRGRSLLAGLDESVLYEAALTVMMRLVFLLTAEERKLLPLDDPFYSENYAAATLRVQQSELADRYGEELLEYRYDAWSRLLATFRVVHSGLYHDRLTLPAYGGSLFDPDRFPFLEGRTSSRQDAKSQRKIEKEKTFAASAALREISAPLPISNRTVLHLLNALQLLQVKVPGGGPAEARRLSFRALDIEQIGHVYESLLDHTAVRASEPVLGLTGTRDKEPEIPLSKLEEFSRKGAKTQREKENNNKNLAASAALREIRETQAPYEAQSSRRNLREKDLLDFLKAQTGRSASALKKALPSVGPGDQRTRLVEKSVKYDIETRHSKLRAACHNDEALYRRVLPWAELIRDDDFGHPVVIPADSVYVTAGTERRATGTHYTPKALTEPIVQHTLEPLVYRGPAEGKPREAWKLRPASDLLNLKVCDMAMGSGAFLVQTCRYLSERLVEAWDIASRQDAKNAKKKQNENLADFATLREPLLTPEGKPTTNPDEAIPADSTDRLILARRLAADRCLYGVDKNPLAVEMAKLSLWLVTLDKNRPFTFLDHALKCGDSLVGVNVEQLLHWSLDTSGSAALFADTLRTDLTQMTKLRRQITTLSVNTIDDQAEKAHLLARAEAIAHDLKRGGDMLIGSYFNDLGKDEQEVLRETLLLAFRDGQDVPPNRAKQADLGTLRPFHWPLEFPEVFLDEGRKGFDAFVGNPPFIGGRRIRETMGGNYRQTLYELYPGSSGNADYSAFFFLRGYRHLCQGGTLGLIATNTIAQGDTRLTGLDNIVKEEGTLYRAANSQPWPGQAAVVVSVVHAGRGQMQPPFFLDDKSVQHISSLLDSRRVTGNPYPLTANQSGSFIGSFVNGIGFVLTSEEAQNLIEQNPRNKYVLFPYLIGQDLNSSPTQSPSRWVINFFDWSLEKAETYTEPIEIVRKKVYPVRAKVRRKAHRKYWWHYGDKRPALYRAIAPLQRVLIIAQTSKTLAFTFVPKGIVYSHMTVVIASDKAWWFTLLQSNHHIAWVLQYASSLKGDARYIPRDCFETFPFPKISNPETHSIGEIGEAYHEYRRQLMLNRQEGLTKTYNRYHNPEETAAGIARLRELHVEMDQAVAAAYGWDDLDLDHDFYNTPQGLRYTISEAARREVLGRLLELNHQRYEEEVLAGLHEKKRSRKGAKTQRGTKKKGHKESGQLTFLDE